MTPNTEPPVPIGAVTGPAVQGADVVQRLREFARDYTTTSFHDDLINEGIDEIERLRAQVAELEKDAKRYQWLRDGDAYGDYPYPVIRESARANDRALWFEELDAAIDAAMKA